MFRKKEPSLYENIKGGGKLGVLAVIVLAFMIWMLELQYG